MIKYGIRTIVVLSALILQAVPALVVPERAAAATSGAVTSSGTSDEASLRAQAAAYAKSFSQGDASALANMWTADGVFTDASGHEFKGRAEIQRLFDSYFKSRGNRPLEINVQTIKFPTPNTAIEEGTTRVADGSLPSVMNRYMAFHVKENGQWHMAAVAETAYTPATAYDSLKQLEWMVGSWSVKQPTSTGIRFKADWGANRNFIRCEYREDGRTGNAVAKESQMIGWDPVSKEIVSWHFDSNGGFGYGRWARQGSSWVVRANSVQPDGSQARAMYTLNPVDTNMFTWQSTHRLHGSQPLPDTDKITVARDDVVSEK